MRKNKVRLGVSVYPEQETIEQIDSYLALASKYGFTKVFTSLFSVDGTKEEVFNYFKGFCDIAHKYGMIVSGDANTEFFKKMGASETDIHIFKEMGLDILRMDGCYFDDRDVTLINNEEGIKIEMSSGFIQAIDQAIDHGAKVENMAVCHNFYPGRYTGADLKTIMDINEHWKAKGVLSAIFISSQVPGTHGPWPISQGLPTLEDHRELPVDVQLKHMVAMDNIDEVLFGNAFASEEEFALIQKTMDAIYINVPKRTDVSELLANFIPNGNITRIPFKIDLAEGISELEKSYLFNHVHTAGEYIYYMLRSRWTRQMDEIEPRTCDKEYFHKGDVVIVNSNCHHYRGEVQIVMTDMKNDGERNFVGRISEDEMFLLDHIKQSDAFGFIAK